jgi:hypothetical protein
MAIRPSVKAKKIKFPSQGLREPLMGPPCDVCGGVTRLVGIERNIWSDSTDVRTYECKQCGAVLAVGVPPITEVKTRNAH